MKLSHRVLQGNNSSNPNYTANREALNRTRRFSYLKHKFAQLVVATAVGVSSMVGLQGVVFAQVRAADVATPFDRAQLDTHRTNFDQAWNDARTELERLSRTETPGPMVPQYSFVRNIIDNLVRVSVRATNTGSIIASPDGSNVRVGIPGLRVATHAETTNGSDRTRYYTEMLSALLTYFGVTNRNPPVLNLSDLSEHNRSLITGDGSLSPFERGRAPFNALRSIIQLSSPSPTQAPISPEVTASNVAYRRLNDISRQLLPARATITDENNPYRFLTQAQRRSLNTALLRIRDGAGRNLGLDDIPGATGEIPNTNPTLSSRQSSERTRLLAAYDTFTVILDQQASQARLRATTPSDSHATVDSNAIADYTVQVNRLRTVFADPSFIGNTGLVAIATRFTELLNDSQNLLEVSDVLVRQLSTSQRRYFSGNRSRIVDCLIRAAAFSRGTTEDQMRAFVLNGTPLPTTFSAPNTSNATAQLDEAARIRTGDQNFMRRILTAVLEQGYPALVAELGAFPTRAELQSLDRNRRAGTQPYLRSYRDGRNTFDNSREGLSLLLGQPDGSGHYAGLREVLRQYLDQPHTINSSEFVFFFERFISIANLIHRTSASYRVGLAVNGNHATPQMVRDYSDMAWTIIRPNDQHARRSVSSDMLPTLRSLLRTTDDSIVYHQLGTNMPFVQVGQIIRSFMTLANNTDSLASPLPALGSETSADRTARTDRQADLSATRLAARYEYVPIIEGRDPRAQPVSTPAPTPTARAPRPARRTSTARVSAPTINQSDTPVPIESPLRLTRATEILQESISRLDVQGRLSPPPFLLATARSWLTRAQAMQSPNATASEQEKYNYGIFCRQVFAVSQAVLAYAEANIVVQSEIDRLPSNSPRRAQLQSSLEELRHVFDDDFSEEYREIGPTYQPSLSEHLADSLILACSPPLMATAGYAYTANVERTYRLLADGTNNSGTPLAMHDALERTLDTARRSMHLIELSRSVEIPEHPLTVATRNWSAGVSVLDPRFTRHQTSSAYVLPEIYYAEIDTHPSFTVSHDAPAMRQFGSYSMELERQANQGGSRIPGGILADDTQDLVRTYDSRAPVELTPNLIQTPGQAPRQYSIGTLFRDAAATSDVEADSTQTAGQRMEATNLPFVHLLNIRLNQLSQRLASALPENHPNHATGAHIGDLLYDGVHSDPNQLPDGLHRRIYRAQQVIARISALTAPNGAFTLHAQENLSVPGVAPISLPVAIAEVERVLADLSDENVNRIPFVPRPVAETTGDPWQDVLDKYNLEFVRWDSSEDYNSEIGQRLVLTQAYVRARGSTNDPVSLLDWINNHPRSDPRDHENNLQTVRNNFANAATVYVAFNAAIGNEYMLVGNNPRSDYTGHLVRGVQLTVGGRTRIVDAYVAIEPAENGPILGRYREVSESGHRRILFYVRPGSTRTDAGTIEPIINDDGSLTNSMQSGTVFRSSVASAPAISIPFAEGVHYQPVAFIQRNREHRRDSSQ